MDTTIVRIVCVALVAVFGLVIAMRRRGRNTE